MYIRGKQPHEDTEAAAQQPRRCPRVAAQSGREPKASEYGRLKYVAPYIGLLYFGNFSFFCGRLYG